MTILQFSPLAVFSSVVLFFGMPNLEEGRQESRSIVAFAMAQQIKAGALRPDTVDPWGRPFVIHGASTGMVVVTSHGSNGLSPAGGYDSDDISTEMPNPPYVSTRNRKRNQALATIGLAVSPWLVFLATRARRWVACTR